MNYVEQGTNVLRTGLGPQRNKVPLGRNATFSFSYTSGKVLEPHHSKNHTHFESCIKIIFSGTIEKLIVNNVTNGETSLIGEFTVTDKFNADEFLIHILFETVCNFFNCLII